MEYVIIVAIITGISEVLKSFLGKQYIELIVLIIGIIAGLLFVEENIGTQVFVGMAFGLSSMGLFDLSNIVKKETRE